MIDKRPPVDATAEDRLRALEVMVVALSGMMAHRDPSLGADLEAALLRRVAECEALLKYGERTATRNLLASWLAEMAQRR